MERFLTFVMVKSQEIGAKLCPNIYEQFYLRQSPLSHPKYDWVILLRSW